jgi:hypothetical protein
MSVSERRNENSVGVGSGGVKGRLKSRFLAGKNDPPLDFLLSPLSPNWDEKSKFSSRFSGGARMAVSSDGKRHRRGDNHHAAHISIGA